MGIGLAIALVLLPLVASAWTALRVRGIKKAHEKHAAAYERELGAWLLRRLTTVPGSSSGGDSGHRSWWQKARK